MTKDINKKGILKNVGANPYVDWPIIISVAVLAVALFVYIGVSIYRSTKGIDSSSVEVAETSEGLDLDKFTRVIDAFNEKARIQGELKKGYPGAPDPSI